MFREHIMTPWQSKVSDSQQGDILRAKRNSHCSTSSTLSSPLQEKAPRTAKSLFCRKTADERSAREQSASGLQLLLLHTWTGRSRRKMPIDSRLDLVALVSKAGEFVSFLWSSPFLVEKWTKWFHRPSMQANEMTWGVSLPCINGANSFFHLLRRLTDLIWLHFLANKLEKEQKPSNKRLQWKTTIFYNLVVSSVDSLFTVVSSR